MSSGLHPVLHGVSRELRQALSFKAAGAASIGLSPIGYFACLYWFYMYMYDLLLRLTGSANPLQCHTTHGAGAHRAPARGKAHETHTLEDQLGLVPGTKSKVEDGSTVGTSVTLRTAVADFR